MQDPAKYVIKAQLTADGVVERSDVVGAVFGQTEGLLGDELDLRALQDHERVGRIEVTIESAAGRSAGTLQIQTDLDRIETAVLAAALETIDRIGPCRAAVTIDRIEDLRAAKRREIVDRAQQLLAGGFEDVGLGGRDLVAAVREATTPAEITSYRGFPAGPAVGSSDEVIIVEGRADVRRLLEYGITNVVGVEGTDVPDEIAELAESTETTAFFDGDRGGNLLLLELAQISDVDYVTFAPPERSVEDLSMAEVYEALARKVPYDGDNGPEKIITSEIDEALSNPEPALLNVLTEIYEAGEGDAAILDANGVVLQVTTIDELKTDLQEEGNAASTLIIDAVVGQEIMDLAARHGIETIIARDRGEFTKRPLAVRVLTADRILDRPETVA